MLGSIDKWVCRWVGGSSRAVLAEGREADVACKGALGSIAVTDAH